ncbi:MAG: methyltransferase domain-containing protein [Gemmataceae bacterium]
MDHSTVNRVFVDDFLAAWDGQGSVLDVGTGTALIPIELCRRDGRARVVAVDAAAAMLALARRNVEDAGLASVITLDQVDGKRLPYADARFGAVMSNSIIHHIPEPFTVLAEMSRVAAPGGLLFVRDLLRPDDERMLRELVDLHAAGANDHQRQLFADSLHAALSLAEVRELVGRLGFDPAGVQQTTGRHWTWVARKPA